MNEPDASGRGRAEPPSGRFQFGMRGLMATMLLLCVPFAIWGGLLRAGKPAQGNARMYVFVLLSVAAPMGVMILISLALSASRAYRRLRRRR
ncbi:MAG TPA: hypothetical protein VMV10_00095 [Pirellulales bacterium]|nr:hypothetical protein [Pirellulales bacterium]